MNNPTRHFTYALSILLAVPFAPCTAKEKPAVAEELDSTGPQWVRLLRDEDDRVTAMQTAITRYVTSEEDGSQVSVDLIGAVHVGDRSYYRKLNKHFRQYDVVLYELVAPDGRVVPQRTHKQSNHPVATVQRGMKDALKLDHQLEQIDYTRSNFVHADMSPEDFAESMRGRDEGWVKMYFRMMGQSIGQQSRMAFKGKAMDMQMLTALFAKDRARQLKLVMAEQLAESEGMFSSFGGEAGSTLITERNKVALAVLKEQLAAGKLTVGIFYGAGHMVDIDERLREEFGLQPVRREWMTAWNLEK